MFTDYETMSVYTAKAWGLVPFQTKKIGDSPGFAWSSALHKDVLNSYEKSILRQFQKTAETFSPGKSG